MENDKIRTMIHFAVKSSKSVIGADNVLKNNRAHCKLIFIDPTLGPNTLSKIKNFCTTREIRLIAVDFDKVLGLSLKDCKVLGMTDSNMCNLVCKELNSNTNYSIILGGSNLG